MPAVPTSLIPKTVIVKHALMSLIAAAVIGTLVFTGVILCAFNDAHRTAEVVAKQVAASVIAPLSRVDFSTPRQSSKDQTTIDLGPFLSSGIVRRVKVWVPDGNSFRIAYSDETALEGLVEPATPAHTATPPPGELTVQAVPHNFEHRFEDPVAANLLEVFVPFDDAGHHRAVLELYVPTRVDDTEHRIALTILPLLAAGIVVLAVATYPLTLSVSRRLARSHTEQRAARRYGISSAEATRTAIARSIHNSVIPGLSGARMLLELANRDPGRAAQAANGDLIERARAMLSDELDELRDLLGQLLPASSATTGLDDVVRKVQRWHVAAAPRVTVESTLELTPDSEARSVINGVAEELLRNAFRHAASDHVSVRLTSRAEIGFVLVVSDDGCGLDPELAATATGSSNTGVGLRLSTKLIEDLGGTMRVTGAPGTGTTVIARLPATLAIARDGTERSAGWSRWRSGRVARGSGR